MLHLSQQGCLPYQTPHFTKNLNMQQRVKFEENGTATSTLSNSSPLKSTLLKNEHPCMVKEEMLNAMQADLKQAAFLPEHDIEVAPGVF